MIDRRVSPDGKVTYRVRLYFRGRYVSSRTFQRLTDARNWQRDQERQLSTGSFANFREGDLPISDWYKRWQISLTGLAPDTEIRYESLGRIHLLPEFGRRPLNSIKPSEVQAFAGRLSSENSASTARQAVGVLRQIVKFAKKDGAITVDPTEGVRLPRSKPNEPCPLTHDELWKLASSASNRRDQMVVLVGGYTGLRWGELTALLVKDFDRLGRIEVSKALSDIRGKLVVGDVKDHSNRTVVLPWTVSGMLVDFVKNLDADELIFQSRAKTPLRNKNFRRDFLDSSPNVIGRMVTPHHLRDTAASLAIDSGASVMAVARMLGHEDPSVTLRHYASLFPHDLEDLAKRMDIGASRAMERYRK